MRLQVQNIPFEWKVPHRGFALVETDLNRNPDDWDPLVRLDFPGRGVWRPYQPLHDEPALFREFAALDSSLPSEFDSQALGFANRFGHLGFEKKELRRDVERVPEDLDDSYGAEVITYEPLHKWRTEVHDMAQSVLLWTAIRDAETKTIQDVLSATPRSDADYRRHLERFGYSSWYRRENVPDVERALVFLWDRIQSRIQNYTFPSLIYKPDSSNPLPIDLFVVPENLLGALWLQFAVAIATNPTLQQCRLCGKWFEVPPKARRSGISYCSTRCRSSAHRYRGQARQLLKNGSTPENIAQQLAIDESLVSEWLEPDTDDSEREGSPR